MMNEDITLDPAKGASGQQQLQHQELTMERPLEGSSRQQMQMHAAAGVQCPYCGTMNEPEAVFCASCGKPIGVVKCPNCGADIDPDADFCEVCHHYIRHDVCSFCGARLSQQDAFCPECGSPRGGIICPTCHTLNDFAFCKQCGMPLTDDARQLTAELKSHPEYQQLMQLAREYNELNMQLPYTSERDVVRDQMNDKLRERVLLLLAKDKGVPSPTIPRKENKRMSKEELRLRKEDKLKLLTDILDRMAVPALPSPIKARNYAMAQKPAGVRLAWVCNWKHAMHSSPCGCAKPHLGGKWVILGKNNNQEIKDDNK
jgi:predicted amidophosphoribosyltransferase